MQIIGLFCHKVFCRFVKNNPVIRRLLFILLLSPLAGYSQSVTIGQGTYGGTNVYGPLYAISSADTSYSRQAFIYPASLLTGLEHGDTISSLDFYAQADQAMSGNVNLRIYLKVTRNDTFPSTSLNFTNEINSSGMVLVYDANPIKMMDGSSGYKNFNFNINKFKYDTSGGKKNLEIVMLYTQMTRQATNTFWLYENNFSISAFKSRNEGKINYGVGNPVDTSRFSDVRKPHIRIHFPRYNQNLEVLKTYCLGKVPLLAGVNDTIRVLVGNLGKRKIGNARLYLTITGANTHRDSISISNMDPWTEQLFNFGQFKPDSSGEDNVQISLSHDDFDANNYDTVKRQINYNVFSHTDPYIGNSGGIGFNGSTGDFVAKFYSDSGVYINQISVDFSSSGRGFRVGIWDDDASGGFPGTVLFMSDSLTSKGGTYILPVLPRVKVNGGFYVGIRQNTTTNVAFSFQDEDPIRPGAFYFTAPMGNTVWTPFSPGFPFKFNIQPRIQVADDVAPLSIIYPSANQDIEYSIKDSMGPQVNVVNYGFKDQTTPFEVECKITNLYDIEEYKFTKKITLNSGQSKIIYFDTAFRLYNLGSHKITVTTKLANDKIVDNNSLSQVFTVSVKNDVGADIMYTPVDGGIYEYKKDTIIPTVRINNFGTVTKSNFNVTFRIRNDTSVIYSETLTRTLTPGKQEIISFPKFIPKVIGDFIAECYTSLKDSIPYNDTVRHKIIIQKSDDVGVKQIDIPSPTAIYTMGGFFFGKAVIKNFGLKNQLTPFKTHLYVFNQSGTQIFYDTVSTQLGGFSETQLSFKRFNIPNSFGKYKVFYRTELKGDQEPENDTLTGFFTVIPNKDLTVLKVLIPAKDSVMLSENLPFRPRVTVKNLGSLTLSNPGTLVIKIFRQFVLVYEDSVVMTGNISYNSNLTFNFNQDFLLPTPGNLSVKVFCRLPGDLITKNDTLNSRFSVQRNYDLAIDSLSNFSNNQVFTYESKFFKPQILIINNGSKTYPMAFNLQLDLYNDTGLFKSKNLTFDSLSKSFVNSLFIDSFISLRQVGNFKLCAKLDASLDLNTGNNDRCWNFSIVKPRDLALDSILFPEKSNFCYQDKIYRPRLKATNLGSLPIVNTMVDLKIYETTNYVWSHSKFIDLNPGESKWLVFDSTLQLTFLGTGKAQAVSFLANDNEKANDTAIRIFNIAQTSAINTPAYDKVSIFPNPSTGIVNFETPDNSAYQIKISNIASQRIVSDTYYPSKQLISIDLKKELNLTKGIYIISIGNSSLNKTFRLILF